jgi:catechol 2,3-dioxygenase-like lactoylglutathione lyase family enzyme
MSQLVGVHHLNFTVRDIRASMAWYQELLGLEWTFEREDKERGWLKAGLLHRASGLRINFTQHLSGSGDTFSEFRTGLDHVAIQVSGGRAGLERWLTRLAERDVDHSEIKPGDVGDLITFRDPDNIQLELYAPTT